MKSALLLSSALLTAAATLVGAAVLAPTPAVASSPSVAPRVGEYDLDASHSSVHFRVRHVDVSYTWGRFDRMAGSFTIAEDPAASQVSVTIDAASVDSNDEGRDKHLRSPDFLNAKAHPEISFESTKIEAEGDDAYSVTGTLSLHGEEREVEFDMEFIGARETPMGYKCGFEGQLVIDRRDYGIDTYPAEMIGDEITLYLAVEGNRK